MRFLFTAALLSCCPLAAVQGQQGQLSDSTLATGTHVRFWSRDAAAQGWLQGTVIRVFPSNGATCLAMHSETLSGFRSIQRIDSLQVAVPPSSPAAANSQAAATTTPTQWRNVPVGPLRAREHGCTFSAAAR